MKHLKQIMMLAILVSSMVLISCSTDDSGDDGNAPGGTLVAKVDGVSFQSLEISSSATVANTGGNQNLVVIASNSDANAFAFTIIGYQGADRTYPIGGDVNIVNTASYTETNVDLANPMNSTTEVWQAPFDNTMVGEIFISEETDTTIKGTFSFKCKNVNGDQSVKTISEGSFNLNKQTT